MRHVTTDIPIEIVINRIVAEEKGKGWLLWEICLVFVSDYISLDLHHLGIGVLR